MKKERVKNVSFRIDANGIEHRVTFIKTIHGTISKGSVAQQKSCIPLKQISWYRNLISAAFILAKKSNKSYCNLFSFSSKIHPKN